MKPNHDLVGGQRGFVLIFALVILVTLTFLGFMASRTAVMEMTLSNNERLQRQTFSVADGGTMAATRILQENIDCPAGFSPWVISKGVGAIQFKASAAIIGQGSEVIYNSDLPLAVRSSLPPLRENAASPEIMRQVCIGGEGINTLAVDPTNNGCTPPAAGVTGPHTNILFQRGITTTSHGNGLNDIKNSITHYDIYSQHVTYQGTPPTVTRESIIRMGWGQQNNNIQPNCIWQ